MRYPTVQWAEKSPDHPILFDGPVVITHAGLEERVVAAAQRLQSLGVESGARVALLAVNSALWITIAHAVVRVGAILVPLNTRLSLPEITNQLEYYLPKLIIADTGSALALAQTSVRWKQVVRLGTPSDRNGPWWNHIKPASGPIGTDADPDRICTIISTSGTTGTPKGVCLSLSNHLAAAEASQRNLPTSPADRWLINLPLFHIGGLSIIYRSAVSGVGMVVHQRFGVQETIAAVANEGVTHLSLVENMLVRLMDGLGDGAFPAGLRAVLVGGGPVRLELLREARQRGMPVLPTYGLTESTSQVSTLSLDAAEDRLGTSGRPLPGCDVEIRDASGDWVPAGTSGQIWIRGPMVMRGYWNVREEKPSILPDRWCATGDIGVMDSSGFLTVHGRADDMIVSGGEKFFPTEIEAALGQLAGIRESAIVAQQDPIWGQVPVAFVVPNPGWPEASFDWSAALAGALASYKIPKRYITVAALPRTGSGKVDRRRLAAMLREQS